MTNGCGQSKSRVDIPFLLNLIVISCLISMSLVLLNGNNQWFISYQFINYYITISKTISSHLFITLAKLRMTAARSVANGMVGEIS